MTRRALLIALVVLVAVASGVGLFLYLFKPVTEQLPLPPKGEAAYNPLYALKLSLRAQGLEASSYSNLNLAELVLRDGDTVLLFTRPEALTEAQAQRLLSWVARGGHLIMPGPESAGAAGPLADALGLKASHYEAEDEESEPDKELPSDCTHIAPRPGVHADDLRLCGPRFVASSDEFVMSDGDAQRGYRFARAAWGLGAVTVSDLSFLDNRRLNTAVARELAFQLLAPRLGKGGFHLVYSADVPSLWRLLLLYGWPVLLPLLLALAAWLVWRGQRFGPLLPLPAAHRRALLEHVQAAGEFAFRRGRGMALHTSVLTLFKQRLLRRDPALAALDGEALVQALSERLSMDAQRIRQALKPLGMQRPDVFQQSISTLLQMRNRL